MELKITELQEKIGYIFNNKSYLLEAITHPSTSYKQKKKNRFNYERLEFLGDAILSTVMAEYIFKKFPHEPEGVLSKKKAILVSKDVLSKIGSSLDIGNYIIMTKGEENTNGRYNINNLENVMEAIIGAIYLDSNELGFDNAKKIIMRLWKDFLNLDSQYSSKTTLQEWVQKKYKKLPKYNLEKTEIIDKQEIFTVSLSVPNFNKLEKTGRNIKEIEKELASDFLKNIHLTNKSIIN